MLRRRDELPCLTDTSSSSSSSSTSSSSASPLSPMGSSSSVINNIRKQEIPMVEKMIILPIYLEHHNKRKMEKIC